MQTLCNNVYFLDELKNPEILKYKPTVVNFDQFRLEKNEKDNKIKNFKQSTTRT